MKRYFLLHLLVAVGSIEALNQVHGTIDEDTQWFFSKLSVRPAMTVSIEYTIEYPYDTTWHVPVITFYYDGEDSVNLHRKCNADMQGQLCNNKLAVPLDTRYYSEDFECSASGCTRREWSRCEYWSCHGRTKIQDFEPKSYSFSLGFECHETKASLKGIYYNVTIPDESNQTNCVNLNKVEAERLDNCELNYQYAAIPNQVGATDLDSAVKMMNTLQKVLGIGHDSSSSQKYKKKLKPFLCGIFLPKCMPEENKIILPCRDTCKSLLKDCITIDIITNLVGIDVNCDYLPPCPSSTLILIPSSTLIIIQIICLGVGLIIAMVAAYCLCFKKSYFPVPQQQSQSCASENHNEVKKKDRYVLKNKK